MAVPPLQPFIDPLPSAPDTATPETWLSQCLAAQANQIVILDAHQHPKGLVLLHRLVTTVIDPRQVTAITSQHTALGEDHSRSLTTKVISAAAEDLLEPCLLVSWDTPLTAVVQQVSSEIEATWIVVDAQRQYVGRLNPARLFNHVLGQSEPGQSADSVASDATAEQPQQAVLSVGQAVLLTYLGHELKTPLTSLLGLSSLLGTQRLGSLNDRQARYIELIQQHSRRLTALVNTVLDLGRIESGTLQLMPQRVSLPTLCQEAYRQAVRSGDFAQVTCSKSPCDHIPDLSLVADPLRLGQILTYLIRATLTVSPARSCPLSIRSAGAWVLCRPWPHSHSADSDLHQSLHLLSSATPPHIDTDHATSWLELLLVRRLAQLHGGDLVKMAHGDGDLCPTLLLPYNARFPQPPAGHFVLLVAPDADAIAQVQAQVTPLGYQLIITDTPEETLAVAARLSPVAVLLHLDAPTVQQHLSKLKADPRTCDCPAIALTPPTQLARLTALAVDQHVFWPTPDLASALSQPQAPLAPLATKLTVLYLRAAETRSHATPGAELPDLLHDCGCRVLEVDDLDQASLLTRVWKPQVAVLDPALASPEQFLRDFSQYPELTRLGLVSLTRQATQIAHGHPNLAVFPCLVNDQPRQTPEQVEQVSAWLLQAIQVAANHVSTPSD